MDFKIPRIRFVTEMGSETPFTEEDVERIVTWMKNFTYEESIESVPKFHPNSCVYRLSWSVDKEKKKYLIYDEDKQVVGIRWSLIHGKNKNRIRLAAKQAERRVRNYCETFNKYAGKKGVVMIHARIGGNNWLEYGGSEISRQPWFLEKVDDYFDSTYCDIYVTNGGE